MCGRAETFGVGVPARGECTPPLRLGHSRGKKSRGETGFLASLGICFIPEKKELLWWVYGGCKLEGRKSRAALISFFRHFGEIKVEGRVSGFALIFFPDRKEIPLNSTALGWVGWGCKREGKIKHAYLAPSLFFLQPPPPPPVLLEEGLRSSGVSTQGSQAYCLPSLVFFFRLAVGGPWFFGSTGFIFCVS